jgi:hypothetical protein
MQGGDMTRHEPEDDEMREEYDFSQSVRAPYAALAGDVQVVTLDADVRAAFPDSQSVNEALRVLIKAAQGVKDLRKAS